MDLFDSRLTPNYSSYYISTMKIRLLLSLLVTGLLCAWTTTETSIRTQKSKCPCLKQNRSHRRLCDLVITDLLKDQFGQQVVRPAV